VIGSVATPENAFGSLGRYKEVDINHVDHDMCNKQNDGDFVDSVMLCVGVLGGGDDSYQGDSSGPTHGGIECIVIAVGYRVPFRL
jgi:hypothetical protein